MLHFKKLIEIFSKRIIIDILALTGEFKTCFIILKNALEF